MVGYYHRVCPLLALLVLGSTAAAEPTRIEVRVRSQAGKFIGTSMGGARVIIRNEQTGEILAQGITRGTTGDTTRIMKEKQGPGDRLSTPDAALFAAAIDIDEPTRILVEASGPLAQPQAIQRVTTTGWLIPGKHITAGDGFLLSLPGFVVDILAPPAHVQLGGPPQTLVLRANVTLMCGCPVEPGGMWDASQYEIGMILKRDGEQIASEPLSYAGQSSQFQRELKLDQPGVYEATVFAYAAQDANTGIDKVTFIVKDR